MGRSYTWPFVNISRPLLGADFLALHGLLVHVTWKCLLATGTCCSRPLTTSPAIPLISTPTSCKSSSTYSSQNSASRLQAQGLPLPDSKETRWHLETLRELSLTQPHHNTRSVTLAKYARPHQHPARGEDVHRYGPQIVLPGPRPPGRHPNDGHHHDLWDILIHPLHLRPQKRRATFQRLMDSILSDLPFCCCYLDDIIIFSRSREEHKHHIHAVLKHLQENGLVVHFDKCTFGAERVDFLGHKVSSTGVHPMTSKVEAVRTFPTPMTIKVLQEFLSMVNYY
ncbi:uncharacterized protein [Palaemon carinicauda]|uniref:uncharacterized protein n=1 Tax=Palaemon carinicauda TaxID=392227 RepID=UPI0035B6A9C9